MERTLDIFKNDAFTQASLRRVLPTMPFTPGEIGRMNLYRPHYIDTETVLIYMENGIIRLIPVTQRGGPDVFAERRAGAFRAVKTLRLSKRDQVNASELLGVADTTFPLEQRLRTAMGLTNERMGQLQSDMEATKELHRLGGIMGKILDADGTTVLVDFYDLFGIAEPTPEEIDFDNVDEDNLAADMQAAFLVPIFRSLQTRTPGLMASGLRLVALCSDEFWDKLIRHAAVREIWKAQQVGRAIAMQANPLSNPPLWESIWFGGVEWRHFMGALSGPLKVPAEQAIIFPVGAQDVFDAYFSPGETLSQVGRPGQELYPMTRTDPRDDPEFEELILRSYPLYACIYPQALMRASLPQ